MRIDILTLFPDMFSALKESILGRAQRAGKIEINVVDIREFTEDKHLKCDDYPFGGGAGMVMLTIKPHVAARFASWGHIWEDVYDKGFQQTHTLTAAASGGMIGVGAGKGWLSNLPAADTDIVFGMLCEEWGLVIAVLTILCIITLAVFAVRACRAGRSSFYTIAACAATSLLVFQTCLNVFGAVDILPFTGVTLPFVSNGGSSMLSAWGMLAFLKATDTRQNASFAVRLPSRRELRGEE